MQIEALGIEGDTLQWIKDFLVGRRQRVSVNGSVSDWVAVKAAYLRTVFSVPSYSWLSLIICRAQYRVCVLCRLMTQKSMVQSAIVKTEISYKRTLMHRSIGQILGRCVSTLTNVKYFTWERTMSNVATK